MQPVNTMPKTLVREPRDELTLLTVCSEESPPFSLTRLSATILPLYLPLEIAVVWETCRAGPVFVTPRSSYDVGTVDQRPHNSTSSVMPWSLDLCLPVASSLNEMVRTGGRNGGLYHLGNVVNPFASRFKAGGNKHRFGGAGLRGCIVGTTSRGLCRVR